MKNFRLLFPMLPNIVLTALVFFLLQAWAIDSAEFRMLILIYIPLYCLTSALIYGVKNGFHWFYPFVIGLLFGPVLFTVINTVAIKFVFLYFLISLMGLFIGSRIVNLKNR